MPKINQLTRASRIADTDMIPKENTSGTSTEAFTAQQLADYVKGKIPAPDTTLSQSGKAADAAVTGEKITDLKNAVEHFNYVNEADLLTIPSATYTDGFYTFTDSNAYNTYGATSFPHRPFKENTVYTLSAIVKQGSGAGTKGIVFQLRYTDDTHSDVVVPLDVSTPTTFYVTSTIGKTVAKVNFSMYSSATVYMKNFMMTEGSGVPASFIPYSSASAIDLTAREKCDRLENEVFGIENSVATIAFDDLGLKWENYDITGTPDLIYSNTKLTTEQKINASDYTDVTITAASGYRFYIAMYKAETDTSMTLNNGWQTGTNTAPLMFPYIRIVLSKSSGTIDPADASNYTITFTKRFSKQTAKERSILLDRYLSKYALKYDFGNITYNNDANTYFPYHGSGTLDDAAVWISDLYECTPGDSIDYILCQESNRPVLQTYKADGTQNYYVAGTNTTTDVKGSYTFTASDKYFRLSTRTARFRFAYVRYHSQYLMNEYIPSYAQAEHDTTLTALQTKMLLGNPIVVGFNTDQHVSAKYEPRAGVVFGLRTLKMLSAEVPFDFICLGGDAPSYWSAVDVDVLNDINFVSQQVMGSSCPVVQLVGNHDAIDNVNTITNPELYNVTFKRAVNANLYDSYSKTVCNAYRDDDVQSVRYIFVDSIPRTGYALSDVQSFLTSALSTLPSGYHALIFSHRALNTSLSSDTFEDAIDCGSILGTYAVKIIACISGHSHRDGSATINDNLYICTTTAGLDGLQGATRTIGTADETAYDVFVVDQSNKHIYAVRYGYGSDRDWTYAVS